jgi:hypothetical protein
MCNVNHCTALTIVQMRVDFLYRLFDFVNTFAVTNDEKCNRELSCLRHALDEFLRSCTTALAACARPGACAAPVACATLAAPAACTAPAPPTVPTTPPATPTVHTVAAAPIAPAMCNLNDSVSDVDVPVECDRNNNNDSDGDSDGDGDNDSDSNGDSDGDGNGDSDSNGDGDGDGDADGDGNSVGSDENRQTFTLSYTLPELSDEPAELRNFQRQYNDATIRLHNLEKRTPYPTIEAAGERERLLVLLDQLQSTRSAVADGSANALSADFSKLEKLVCDEINVVSDRLEGGDSPSSSAEIASTFDLMQQSLGNHHCGGGVGGNGNGSDSTATPRKEDHTHRGILFQHHQFDPRDKTHMLGLLAMIAFVLRDAGADILAAASTCLPKKGLLPADKDLRNVDVVFHSFESLMHNAPIDDPDVVVSPAHTYHFLRSATRLKQCCDELSSKIAVVAFHALKARLKSLDVAALERQLSEQRTVVGFQLPTTASHIAEYALYMQRHLAMRLSATKMCMHTRNSDDVKFAHEHYVHGEIRSGSEPIVGTVLYDADGKAYAIKSVLCNVFVEDDRGKNTVCCRHCRAVAKTVQSARRDSTRVGRPQLKRKLSLVDYAYVKNLRASVRKLRREVKRLSSELQAALKDTGEPTFSGADARSTATVTLRLREEHDLVSRLLAVVKSGQLQRDSWLYRTT